MYDLNQEEGLSHQDEFEVYQKEYCGRLYQKQQWDQS